MLDMKFFLICMVGIIIGGIGIWWWYFHHYHKQQQQQKKRKLRKLKENVFVARKHTSSPVSDIYTSGEDY